jgi:SAM-dependent methyltransferase
LDTKPTATSARARCLGCDASLPEPFLDLGVTPLANSYVRPEKAGEREPALPLRVAWCPSCHLVQLTAVVPPEEMFSEYLYFTSFSDSHVEHARRMADSLRSRFRLNRETRVLEVASNDGYLLQFFQRQGVPVLGVEPARNIAEHALSKGIPTLNRFFEPAAVPEIRSEFGEAQVIIGNNVFAHVPATNQFLTAVRDCLAPSGRAVFEFPHLLELLRHSEFDTIYHEHVFYFSLTAVVNLARRAGLEVFDVERHPIHGGSLRVFLQKNPAHAVTPNVPALLDEEEKAGLTGPARYREFREEVERLRDDLLRLLGSLKASGKRIAAYGAPAKGNTLLNYCGIGADLIDFTVDRSPHKQGLLLPGSKIPILAPDALPREAPDYVLILPWNIADEIVSQQAVYASRGGRFIVPVPRPRVLESARDAELMSAGAYQP